MLESIQKLEKGRKCWRLVNGVLFEKTVEVVIPELTNMIANLETVMKQLNEALSLKKQESDNLEKAYESIMKQSKARQAEQQQERENKVTGGVLV